MTKKLTWLQVLALRGRIINRPMVDGHLHTIARDVTLERDYLRIIGDDFTCGAAEKYGSAFLDGDVLILAGIYSTPEARVQMRPETAGQ